MEKDIKNITERYNKELNDVSHKELRLFEIRLKKKLELIRNKFKREIGKY